MSLVILRSAQIELIEQLLDTSCNGWCGVNHRHLALTNHLLDHLAQEWIVRATQNDLIGTLSKQGLNHATHRFYGLGCSLTTLLDDLDKAFTNGSNESCSVGITC